MPHYDYVCTQCGYQEEVLQKMTDEPLSACPKCQQATFKRKFGGGIGLQFQGSGFYSTDYGDKPPSSAKEKPSSGGGCGCGKTSCNR